MSDVPHSEIIGFLEMIGEDQDSSKKIKETIKKTINLLQENNELCVEKAVLELEDLNQQNVSQYLRTQLWDVLSQLESLNSIK
jgi:uncharacterized protein (UPF0147 family)